MASDQKNSPIYSPAVAYGDGSVNLNGDHRARFCSRVYKAQFSSNSISERGLAQVSKWVHGVPRTLEWSK